MGDKTTLTGALIALGNTAAEVGRQTSVIVENAATWIDDKWFSADEGQRKELEGLIGLDGDGRPIGTGFMKMNPDIQKQLEKSNITITDADGERVLNEYEEAKNAQANIDESRKAEIAARKENSTTNHDSEVPNAEKSINNKSVLETVGNFFSSIGTTINNSVLKPIAQSWSNFKLSFDIVESAIVKTIKDFFNDAEKSAEAASKISGADNQLDYIEKKAAMGSNVSTEDEVKDTLKNNVKKQITNAGQNIINNQTDGSTNFWNGLETTGTIIGGGIELNSFLKKSNDIKLPLPRVNFGFPEDNVNINVEGSVQLQNDNYKFNYKGVEIKGTATKRFGTP